jgi:hypothetical protein
MHKLRQENKEEAPVPEKEKKGKKSKKWLQSTEQFVGKSSGAAISNQMQQQMKRLIESRKATKPRESSVSLEGALGMIGKKTAKTPKQAITISATRTAPANATSHIASLKAAEKIYSAILKYEGLERKKTDNLEEEELEQQYTKLTIVKMILLKQRMNFGDNWFQRMMFQ